MQSNKTLIYILITLAVAVLLVVGLSFLNKEQDSSPGEYDALAQCLKDKGAIFYGAFWCPHCQEQKKLFGKSAKLLPYVECSTPNAQGQLQVCIDKKIGSYPTWEFADGSRIVQTLGLKELAEKSSCPLTEPQINATVTATTTN